MLEPYLRRLVVDILRGIKGYHDNFSIVDTFESEFIDGKRHKSNRQERQVALEFLLGKGLVTVEGRGRWRIAIENRYAFEQLARQLGVVVDELPNLVFYSVETGRGLVNGKPIALKKTNRKIFELLFNSPNTFVPRKVIWKAMGNRINPKVGNSDTFEFNEKISNLRKACKTDANVITIDGGVMLKAETYVYKNNRVEYREIIK